MTVGRTAFHSFCRRKRLTSLGGAALAAAVAALPALAQEIKPGGTMVVALPGDPDSLNASIVTDISTSNLSGQFYSTIVRQNNDGHVLPDLAKSWEISPDGKTYTFHFHDNVKWHDGTPFTAEDVAWSLWNVNKKYNGPASGLLEAVESIEATDPLTAVFKLKYAYPPLLRGLTYFNSSTIVPKHIFKDGDPRQNPASLKPVGTGPFVFKEYKRGSHVILERNPNYHVKGRPYLDRLVFQIAPNESARALALEKGEIDFMPYYAMSLADVDRLKSSRNVKITVAPRQIAGEYMGFINTRQGPLAKKEVRQALYYGLNREELLQKAGFGFGRVSTGPISSEQKVFYTDQVRQYPHDPARAEKMLDEAGYPKGANGVRFPVRVTYDVKEGPMDDTAKLMRNQLAKIGVNVVIEPADSNAWRDKSFKNWDFDITMGSFSTGPDPAIGTERVYVCRNIERLFARNASGYCNPKLDEIFAAAAKELDEPKRVQLYHEAQKILAEDVPHLWLWYRYYPIAFNAKLVGLPAEPTQYGAYDNVGFAK
jgi:peptide/nickel transport system substrate-binding protein